jgi:hypothetical protein
VAESLTFQIAPETEFISYELLEQSLSNIRRLVVDVDFAFTGEKIGRIWIVQDIRSSDPTITIRPMVDGSGVVDVIANGLAAIIHEDAYSPPVGYSIDALQDLRSMDRLFRGRERLRFLRCKTNDQDIATIDTAVKPKVDRILHRGYWLLGSIEGHLDALNLHGATTFTIWDRVTGAPVRCYFAREDKERIKGLLEHRVLVAGLIRYFQNGTPHTISQITEIRDRGSKDDAPKVDFGSIPQGYITSGQDSVDYVKALRE